MGATVLAMGQSLAWTVRCTATNALCIHTPWNEPAWFVSALFFCWLAFPLFYRHLMALRSNCACATVALLLYALNFWDLVVWRALENVGASSEEVERWAAILSRHPLANLHKFVLGMVLARWLLLAALVADGKGSSVAFRPERLPWPVRHAATPATAALLVLWVVTDPDDFQGREAAIVGLFSLLICGLAAGVDPLARLMQLHVCAWWGRFSYAVYILHGPAIAYTSTLTMDDGWQRNDPLMAAALLPIVLVFALLAHYGVERPVAHFYRQPPLRCCAGRPREVQPVRAARAARAERDELLPTNETAGASRPSVGGVQLMGPDLAV